MSSAENETQFCFRKHDNIGAADAIDDTQFLADCFVDTGELDVLLNCDEPKRIVVGRTGAGKTALLTRIGTKGGEVINLSPHELSLNYIANNTVIQFFENAGLNLSPFYGLLWRHIFVVELLKKKYSISSEESQRDCLRRLRGLLKRDQIREQAVDYLEKWGKNFWLTTDERMKELTKKIESSLSASVEGKYHGFGFGIEGARALSTEEKIEVVELGRKAVSEVQIRELENLIDVLDDHVFCDRMQRYYVTIDALDEPWADDRIRFRLIKALIDSVKRFKKMRHVKIILTIRQDLLDKVLHSVADPGFQEEKYKSLYLYIDWSESQLKDVVVRRLNHLIRRKYTRAPIVASDVLTRQVMSMDPVSYMVKRTFRRPRDLILFINECIALCAGKPDITAHTILEAEGNYSRERLQSLGHEWVLTYPNLKGVIEMFRGMRSHFEVSDISEEFLLDRFVELAEGVSDISADPVVQSLNKLSTNDANFHSIRSYLVKTLFLVGVFGLKLDPSSSVSWSYDSRSSVGLGQVKPSTKVYIHPMFFQALEVRT